MPWEIDQIPNISFKIMKLFRLKSKKIYHSNPFSFCYKQSTASNCHLYKPKFRIRFIQNSKKENKQVTASRKCIERILFY